MPSGGRLIVVAGDRHNLYDDIAKLCKVNLEAIINRHVIVVLDGDQAIFLSLSLSGESYSQRIIMHI